MQKVYLKKAREMAREQGDDKLVRQISNTIINTKEV